MVEIVLQVRCLPFMQPTQTQFLAFYMVSLSLARKPFLRTKPEVTPQYCQVQTKNLKHFKNRYIYVQDTTQMIRCLAYTGLELDSPAPCGFQNYQVLPSQKFFFNLESLYSYCPLYLSMLKIISSSSSFNNYFYILLFCSNRKYFI